MCFNIKLDIKIFRRKIPVKNNKVKIIIITSIVAVVVIIAIVLTAILIQPDPIPLPEDNLEDPVVSTYDPYVDIDAKVTEINTFFKTPIQMSTYMKDRVVLQDLEIEDSIKNSPVKLPDINVEEVLFSNNVTKIRYEYDKESYIILKDNGYYVINEHNKAHTFDFKAIAIPDLSGMPAIKSENIIYSEGSNIFFIQGDYVKRAVEYLIMETNLLSNFDQMFTEKEWEEVLSKMTFSASFKLDENKNINYFTFKASITKNEQEKNLLNLVYEKTSDGLSLTIKSNLEEQIQFKFTVRKPTSERYNLSFNMIRYTLAGEESSNVTASCNVRYVEDSPFEYQEYMDEYMVACDHILNNVHYINKYKQVEKYNALSYCEKFAVYDTDLRAYALFHIEHEEDADTLKFDGLQIYINEDEYCMCTYSDSNYRNIHINVEHHTKAESWNVEIQEKYAAGVAVDPDGRYLDRCEYLRIYDRDYGVQVLLKRHLGLYYLVEYGEKVTINQNICVGEVDYENGNIYVTEHCDREKIENLITENKFYLAGYVNCEYIACRTLDFYLIFYYDGTRLHYVRTQYYADGMCQGTVYLDTGRVVVDKYSHTCEH